MYLTPVHGVVYKITNVVNEKVYVGQLAGLICRNNSRKKSVIQLDQSGNVIECFSNIQDAAKKSKCFDSAIIKVCKGKQKTSGGYFWKYG